MSSREKILRSGSSGYLTRATEERDAARSEEDGAGLSQIEERFDEIERKLDAAIAARG